MPISRVSQRPGATPAVSSACGGLLLVAKSRPLLVAKVSIFKRCGNIFAHFEFKLCL
jgi:hypothetical protein